MIAHLQLRGLGKTFRFRVSVERVFQYRFPAGQSIKQTFEIENKLTGERLAPGLKYFAEKLLHLKILDVKFIAESTTSVPLGLLLNVLQPHR